MRKNFYKTWIEIDTKALKNNIRQFRKILQPKVKIMAVVKSNAYGHGILNFPQATEKLVDWFGADSLSEGLRLRANGIKKPILVLGYTLPARYDEAVKNNISLTIYNKEEIKKLPLNLKVHLKIDTGMHRQGIYLEDLNSFLKELKKRKIILEGVYTHFTSAKDITYPFYILQQSEKFKKAVALLHKAGHRGFLRHAAATGSALLYPETHLDMVRLGIGLYGYWPSAESKIQFILAEKSLFSVTSTADSAWSPRLAGSESARTSERVAGRAKRVKETDFFKLRPILTWKTIVAQVKKIKKGDYIGYDLTEKMPADGKIAVLPIGYWHGYDRRFSSIGEVLIKNKRCKVLGRVSMDMVTVDISDIDGKIKNQKSKIKIGEEVILLGKDLPADELALKIGTISYELLTRINPLIPRIFK